MEYNCPIFIEVEFSNGEWEGFYSRLMGGLGNGYFYCSALMIFETGYGNGHYHYNGYYEEIKFDFNRICM